MKAINHKQVERELHEARMEQRKHGHDWDVADVMAVLQEHHAQEET